MLRGLRRLRVLFFVGSTLLDLAQFHRPLTSSAFIWRLPGPILAGSGCFSANLDRFRPPFLARAGHTEGSKFDERIEDLASSGYLPVLLWLSSARWSHLGPS